MLDAVSEVTVRIQGSTDTFLSQAMFFMWDLMEILSATEQLIRIANRGAEKPVPTELMLVRDLTSTSQKVRQILLTVRDEKDLGRPTCSAERIAMLLDPRRKSFNMFVGGDDEVERETIREKALSDVRRVGGSFLDDASASAAPQSTTTVTGEPAFKKHKSTSHSRMEQRREARLVTVVAEAQAAGIASASSG